MPYIIEIFEENPKEVLFRKYKVTHDRTKVICMEGWRNGTVRQILDYINSCKSKWFRSNNKLDMDRIAIVPNSGVWTNGAKYYGKKQTKKSRRQSA